jgi:hypothetical protein
VCRSALVLVDNLPISLYTRDTQRLRSPAPGHGSWFADAAGGANGETG